MTGFGLTQAMCFAVYIYCKVLFDVGSLEFTRQMQEDREFIGEDNSALTVIVSTSSEVSLVIFVFIEISYSKQ